MATLQEVFGSVCPTGLVHVTGASGVGKSLFSIGLIQVGVDPQRIAVFDCEQSLRVHAQQLRFGAYFDMIGEFVANAGLFGRPRLFLTLFRSKLNSLPDGAFDVIVIDNLWLLEDAIVDEIDSNPTNYGLSSGQMERAIGLKWGPIKDLYRQLMHLVSLKAPLQIVTTPVSQVYSPAGKPVPGAFKPSGKMDVLRALTTMQIWLINSASGSFEPDGLILKSRMVQFVQKDSGFVPIPLLPVKLQPCTWRNILEHVRNPRDWTATQINLSPEDIAKLQNTLTPDQMNMLKMMLAAEAHADQSKSVQPSTPRNLAEFVAALSKLGLTLDQALVRLGKSQISEIEPESDYTKLLTQ